MMRSPLRSLAALALVLAAPAVAAPAVAADQVTLRVSYGDLDLTRYDGVNELKARISSAAEEACAPSVDWVLSGTGRSDCEATLKRKGFAEVENLAAAAAAAADLP